MPIGPSDTVYPQIVTREVRVRMGESMDELIRRNLLDEWPQRAGGGRDPLRIPEILKRLFEVWVQHPDLRLGQLLINVVPSSTGMYYIENDGLLSTVEDFYEEHDGLKSRGEHAL